MHAGRRRVHGGYSHGDAGGLHWRQVHRRRRRLVPGVYLHYPPRERGVSPPVRHQPPAAPGPEHAVGGREEAPGGPSGWGRQRFRAVPGGVAHAAAAELRENERRRRHLHHGGQPPQLRSRAPAGAACPGEQERLNLRSVPFFSLRGRLRAYVTLKQECGVEKEGIR